MTKGIVRVYDFLPPHSGFLQDVLAGLSGDPKELPSKYFYDAEGSRLFEAICELPEYYVRRAELALMDEYTGQIASFIGPAVELIELGSGSGLKTKRLIEALRPLVYVPVDIARTQLEKTTEELAARFPWLNISALLADFTGPLSLPRWQGLSVRRRAVYFPGSTIGNFSRAATVQFLSGLRDWVGPGGAAVIGVDLKKDPKRLHAAYNDAAGITAAFNLNLLRHLNRVAGADFDCDEFEHVAFYNEDLGRIEMHLRSLREQHVRLADHTFSFACAEMVRTEISCKYSVEEFQALAGEAGLEGREVWLDREGLFSVHGLVAQ